MWPEWKKPVGGRMYCLTSCAAGGLLCWGESWGFAPPSCMTTKAETSHPQQIEVGKNGRDEKEPMKHIESFSTLDSLSF